MPYRKCECGCGEDAGVTDGTWFVCVDCLVEHIALALRILAAAGLPTELRGHYKIDADAFDLDT